MMKRFPIVLALLLCIPSCELFDKLKVECDGDCDDPTFLVAGETGTDITYSNFSNQFTYDQYGNISKITISGTVIYNDSGNSYEVEGEAIQDPCSYTITVRDEDGNEATCSN
jgi:hypothetical protein